MKFKKWEPHVYPYGVSQAQTTLLGSTWMLHFIRLFLIDCAKRKIGRIRHRVQHRATGWSSFFWIHNWEYPGRILKLIFFLVSLLKIDSWQTTLEFNRTIVNSLRTIVSLSIDICTKALHTSFADYHTVSPLYCKLF